MADIGTKAASEKWGYSQETIRQWCRNGMIPADAPCPIKIKTKEWGE